MPTYTVYLTNVCSTAVTVEVDNLDDAIDAAYRSDDMPGGITIHPFTGSGSVDGGEWQPDSIEDESGTVVWYESTA